MRIVFMGTPDFAVPSLEGLISAGHEVCGVFSQPDKPVGRHQNKLQPTPVKSCAAAHGIPVYQPTKLRDGTALAQLRELAPELVVVAAYGRILPDDILALPPMGCINVHSSLLPKYRGAAPINWAVIRGEKETGVTIMYMAGELDAGDIIAQETTHIDPEETVENVHDRLAGLGGRLLVQTVAELAAGTARRIPQDHSQATLAPMLSRELSPIDWSRSGWDIHNQIRGLVPWPATSTDIFSAEPVKVFKSTLLDQGTDKQPGTVVAAGKEGIDVACGDGRLLRILELQAPGGKRMSAASYLAGHPIHL
ncbi:methionyl-tRNA formyltransferase [Muriventricola aceti]|uniref:methionyl-tRNA formyltransferase n=1 Tax=Muriventricola aceti TaxID=2981773 RepID=UPI000822F6A9|nr:methionyl-tRNA formyltransferase [Muriventricola aceti]MCU6702706.1 methionyl-tRNA formyltransferase [Muriventricola aceti]SCJ17428.1 Methionyl-tRNA formyltransferase [uncultured Flavonifractor sp.]